MLQIGFLIQMKSQENCQKLVLPSLKFLIVFFKTQLLNPHVDIYAVMHSDPILLELVPIRSRSIDLELDPIQIHYFPIGTRSVPVPIRSRSSLLGPP